MEIWDILDENGEKTGRTIIRGEELKEDEYHLEVHIWIINSEDEILIQKRPKHLKYAPNIWAMTGGCVMEGEDSLDAILRETKEELGISIDKNALKVPLKHKRKNALTDIWILKQDINVEDITLQKEEVEDVKWISAEELKKMLQEGSFFGYDKEYFNLLSQVLRITF